MLIAHYNHRITNSAVIMGLLQFPIYGLIMAVLQRRIGFNIALVGLVCLHLVFFIIAKMYVAGFS